MKASWQRWAVLSVLGVVLAAGLGGLAVALGRSRAPASLALLGCVGVTATVCLVLLVRLLASYSQLERANAGLEQQQGEVEQASEAKSRFVTHLSHELRTPLNAVIGFSQLMHDERSDAVSDTQREHLEIIRTSASHLLALIDEGLDLAQVESGHIRLVPERVEPAQIAVECVSSMQRMAADQRVQIDAELAPVGWAMLDPGRLRQVMLNYLSNAVKFTGEGGTVTLTMTRVGADLLVQVSDTGPGIAPQDHGRVFQEFVQLTGRRRGGTGLGLAVTKLIVEAQGGTVAVDSRPGCGSTFSATLPAAPVRDLDPAGISRPAPDPASNAVRDVDKATAARRSATPLAPSLVRQG